MIVSPSHVWWGNKAKHNSIKL